MTTSATLPPPLSDAPSVETLERLLAGLHQPVQRGVPSPPKRVPSAPAPQASRGARDTVPPPAAPTPPPSLSWSAHPGRRGLRAPTATTVGLAVATAAGVVAGLVAAGEVLP